MKFQIKSKNLICPVYIYRDHKSKSFDAGLMINDKKISLYHYLIHKMFDDSILKLTNDEFGDLKSVLFGKHSEITMISTVYGWCQSCDFKLDDRKTLEDVFLFYKGDAIMMLKIAQVIPDFLTDIEVEEIDKFVMDYSGKDAKQILLKKRGCKADKKTDIFVENLRKNMNGLFGY